jgi:hypothetical protein
VITKAEGRFPLPCQLSDHPYILYRAYKAMDVRSPDFTKIKGVKTNNGDILNFTARGGSLVCLVSLSIWSVWLIERDRQDRPSHQIDSFQYFASRGGDLVCLVPLV